MRPFHFTLDTPTGPRQYDGVVFQSGCAVVCACEHPSEGPWNVSQFQTVELLEQRLGVKVLFADAKASTTTTPKPAPQPCPLPDGNCGKPDVITGG